MIALVVDLHGYIRVNVHYKGDYMTLKFKNQTEEKTVVVPKLTSAEIRQGTKDEIDTEGVAKFNASVYVSLNFEEELWRDWGFISFADYGERELKKAYRSLMNFKMWGDTIRRTKISLETALRVSSSTFTKLCAYAEAEQVGKERITEMINHICAKELNCDQASEYIRSERIGIENMPDIVKLILKFTKAQAKHTIPKLEMIAEELGTVGNLAYTIELLATIYLANGNPKLAQAIKEELDAMGMNKMPEKVIAKHKKHSHAKKVRK